MYIAVTILALHGFAQAGLGEGKQARAFACLRQVLPNSKVTGLVLGRFVRPGMTHDQVRDILGRPDGEDLFGPPGELHTCYTYSDYGVCVTFGPDGGARPQGISLPNFLRAVGLQDR